MKAIETGIEGLVVIEPDCHGDHRGWFMETYSKPKFEALGITCEFVQDNQSYSAQKGTLRGLHFQKNPMAQSKLLRCTRGKILDVAVDIRKDSPTYKKWYAVELSAENKKQFFMPRGMAHGFVTLTDDVEVQYKVDAVYAPDCDRSIRFDDPEIVPGGVSVQSPTPNYIKVSRLGERWGNEEIFSPHGGWKPYANFDEEICDFDRIPSWYIFDQTSFDGGSWGGMVGGAATENGGMGIGYMTEGLDPELGGWAGWSADNKWELERGWITTGATLDELAANIAASKWDDKMDAEKLKASVARWNELCDKGADEDFGRQQLAKVETGPFYAIPLYPGICNTIGGARRNENANIVDPSGNPIPRLYSAGSFGNMNGHTYAITGGNGSENWCVGRIAGRNAAALEPWDAATEA